MNREEAEKTAKECGEPRKVFLYGEEMVEGWLWEHPDGTEWTDVGDHSEPPPLHPLIRIMNVMEEGKLKLANGSTITLTDSKCGPFVSNTKGWN